MATLKEVKQIMEAILFRKTAWPIVSDDKHSIVKEAWELVIEAQDRQQQLAGTSPGTRSVCQLPTGPSLKIDPQTLEAISLGICSMLFYQIWDIDNAPNYTALNLKLSTIRGQLADGAPHTVVRSYLVDLRSETDLRI